MAEWYLRRKDGSEYGPITIEALRELCERGKVGRSTPLRQGEGLWRTAGECKGLFPDDEPEPPHVDHVAEIGKAASAVGATVLKSAGRAFVATGRGLRAITPRRVPRTEIVAQPREPAVLMREPTPVYQAAPQPAPAAVVHVTNVVSAPRQRQSQALPALVNLFFPPFGQLIQGRILAFFAWFLLLAMAIASILVGIGLILTPLLWFLCVIDAAIYKPRD